MRLEPVLLLAADEADEEALEPPVEALLVTHVHCQQLLASWKYWRVEYSSHEQTGMAPHEAAAVEVGAARVAVLDA